MACLDPPAAEEAVPSKISPPHGFQARFRIFRSSRKSHGNRSTHSKNTRARNARKTQNELYEQEVQNS